MRIRIIIVLAFSLPLMFLSLASAQDSTNGVSTQIRRDTNEVKRLNRIAEAYRYSEPDSSIILAKQALSISKELNYAEGRCMSLVILGEDWRIRGDFPQALGMLFEAREMSRKLRNRELEAASLDYIGIAYVDLGEPRQALYFLFQAKKLDEENSLSKMYTFGLSSIGYAYERLNMLDSALHFHELAYKFQQSAGNAPRVWMISRNLGNVHYKMGNYDKALSFFRQVIDSKDLLTTSGSQFGIARYYYAGKRNLDSSLYYATLAYHKSLQSRQKRWTLDAIHLLAKIYQAKNKPDSTNYYLERIIEIKDSLFGPDKFHQLQLLAINEQQRQQEIAKEKESFKRKVQMSSLLGAIGIFLLIAIILYRNNRQKQKTNRILESTLSHLKSTQAQLIQSEKMASLGELTAGIAHEIQNPLNFVNNFSEVNKELIEDLKGERLKANGERDETLEMQLLNDISQNLEKINHHGKRADAIVKGMMQHARTSTGQKEPTDINALADEYLRLAFHGMRAKDKSFNVELQTYLDPSIGEINVVPQEIGRVLLNLFNNAFYAVTEKKKQVADGNLQEYEASITVSTERSDGKIKIIVKDNGNGIPEMIRDKIFQPFFTTKPAGEGTGLGLSLAYEIVKTHGGEINVDTKEPGRTTFIVQLNS